MDTNDKPLSYWLGPEGRIQDAQEVTVTERKFPAEDSESANYLQYRGKCKEMSETLAALLPGLTVTKGWYHCPIWNTREEHWWCKDAEGKIFDPTKDQFPSRGMGDYEEFQGVFTCEQCKTPVKEEDVVMCGNYVVCSHRCACRLVGL